MQILSGSWCNINETTTDLSGDLEIKLNCISNVKQLQNVFLDSPAVKVNLDRRQKVGTLRCYGFPLRPSQRLY
jgi:hypothetical protein